MPDIIAVIGLTVQRPSELTNPQGVITSTTRSTHYASRFSDRGGIYWQPFITGDKRNLCGRALRRCGFRFFDVYLGHGQYLSVCVRL